MTEQEEIAEARAAAKEGFQSLGPDDLRHIEYARPHYEDPYSPNWRKESKDIYPTRPKPDHADSEHDLVLRWISAMNDQAAGGKL